MTLAVVGTDTGVGKTVVTAALVSRLRDAGRDARAIKPVQTGYPEDDDARVVRAVCGDDDAAVRLHAYGEPLAPAVAARRAGDSLQYSDLLGECRDALADAEVGVLEGAGGLRVPLAPDGTDPPGATDTGTDSSGPDGSGSVAEIVDLVADLDLRALVVARSGLGTLNHTALTVEALRRRDVPVSGIVLNEYEGATVAERTNPDELERMCEYPVWPLPRVPIDGPEDVRSLAVDLPPEVERL